MQTETEAIVLKQTKIAGGRRMLVLFTKQWGKISAGTSQSERGKGKAALALRPFTLGRYQVNRSAGSYHINGSETIASHYRIGEDVDKYICASYILEFTEKLLPEEAPSPALYLLLSDFLDRMEKRQGKYETLVAAYLVKALRHAGSEPRLDDCIDCGSGEDLSHFSIQDGGTVCGACAASADRKERLLYEVGFDIVNILRYLSEQPLAGVDKLALEDPVLDRLLPLLRGYYRYHVDIGTLKSEELMEVR